MRLHVIVIADDNEFNNSLIELYGNYARRSSVCWSFYKMGQRQDDASGLEPLTKSGESEVI